MFPALCLFLMARILISKGQGTDQEFRNYEDIYVPKGRSYFLNVTSNITVANTTCGYHEVHVRILMNSEENVSHSRLASIPLQELIPQSIVGIITNDTQQNFQLEKVSLLSTVTNRNNSRDEFKIHLKLEIVIPEAATNNPLFDEIEFVVRCLNRSDVSGLATRHEAGHYRLVYYSETGQSPTLNSTAMITQASQSLGFPATPSPDPGSSEEKKTPPGEGPTLTSTGIAQASQSLGLPATPSPRPEEKKNPQDTKRKTDGSLAWYFVLAAVFLSVLIWLGILMLSIS